LQLSRNSNQLPAPEIAHGLNVDLDLHGDVVGFDIDHASQKLDLSTLETVALTLQTTKAAWAGRG
jgi:uncharacterized protein YuzE